MSANVLEAVMHIAFALCVLGAWERAERRARVVERRLRSEVDRLEVDLHDLRDHVARELANVPASPYRGAP